jgi:hypothetical protein
MLGIETDRLMVFWNENVIASYQPTCQISCKIGWVAEHSLSAGDSDAILIMQVLTLAADFSCQPNPASGHDYCYNRVES